MVYNHIGACRDILAVVGGSAHDKRARAAAIALAVDRNARLTLIMVAPQLAPFAALVPGAIGTLDRCRLESELILREATASVPNDVSVTSLFVEGSRSRRIVRQARDGGHDLVVMGAQENGRGSRVAKQVLRRSP